MAHLPIFLPNVPKVTVEINFLDHYAVTGAAQEVEELLNLLTNYRKKVTNSLLTWPTSAVEVDMTPVVDEYLSVLMGLDRQVSDLEASASTAPVTHSSKTDLTSHAPEDPAHPESADPTGKGTEHPEHHPEHPAEDPAKDPAKEHAKEPAKDPAKEHAKEPAKEPAKTSEIPLSKAIGFSWSNFSRNSKSACIGPVDFEARSVLLCLGIWHVMAAKEMLSIDAKDTLDQNQKAAYKHLTQAAGVFAFVAEKSPDEKGDQSDLRPNVARALSELSLAEAQTITIQRAETAGHTPSLISSLCRDTSERFERTEHLLTDPNPTPNPDVNQKWLAYVEFKKQLYFGRAYFHQGNEFANPESTSAGKAVKAFEIALYQIKESREKLDVFLQAFPDQNGKRAKAFFDTFFHQVQEKYNKTKKENDMVYFDRVPESPEPLPEPKSNIASAPYKFPEVDKDKCDGKVIRKIKAKKDGVKAEAQEQTSSGGGCCILL